MNATQSKTSKPEEEKINQNSFSFDRCDGFIVFFSQSAVYRKASNLNGVVRPATVHVTELVQHEKTTK